MTLSKDEFILRMVERYKGKFSTPEQIKIYMADCQKHLSDYIDFEKLENIIVKNFTTSNQFPTVAEYLKYKAEVLNVPKSNERDAEYYAELKKTAVPPPPEIRQQIEALKNKLSIKNEVPTTNVF